MTGLREALMCLGKLDSCRGLPDLPAAEAEPFAKRVDGWGNDALSMPEALRLHSGACRFRIPSPVASA